MPILIDRVPATVCPVCRLDNGTAIHVKAENGEIAVTYRCPKCRHVWIRSHRSETDAEEDV
jgi:Zn-finger nucleic acid-binding protein